MLTLACLSRTAMNSPADESSSAAAAAATAGGKRSAPSTGNEPNPASPKKSKADPAAAASVSSALSAAAAASSSAAPAAAAAAAAPPSAAPAANNAEALKLEFLALEHPLKPANRLYTWSEQLSHQILLVVDAENWGSLCMLHQLLTCAKLLWDQTYSDPKWRTSKLTAQRFAADRLDHDVNIYRDLEAELKAGMDKAVHEGWARG